MLQKIVKNDPDNEDIFENIHVNTIYLQRPRDVEEELCLTSLWLDLTGAIRMNWENTVGCIRDFKYLEFLTTNSSILQSRRREKTATIIQHCSSLLLEEKVSCLAKMKHQKKNSRDS